MALNVPEGIPPGPTRADPSRPSLEVPRPKPGLLHFKDFRRLRHAHDGLKSVLQRSRRTVHLALADDFPVGGLEHEVVLAVDRSAPVIALGLGPAHPDGFDALLRGGLAVVHLARSGEQPA